MPIVRKDADIINLRARQYQDVTKVVDIFVKAQTSVHLLRAVEPTLRYGKQLAKFLASNSDDEIPKCEFWNTENDSKCFNLVSRKQLAEAIVAVEGAKL